MNKEAVDLFRYMQRVPKSMLVDRPSAKVSAYSNFFFTRRTLKHLAEKGTYGSKLFLSIPDTLEFPDMIVSGGQKRKMYVRHVHPGSKYTIVVVEDKHTIVTCFLAKQKYLKSFKILWRTAAS